MSEPNDEIEFNLTIASLRTAENALREEPYERLPVLAGSLAITAMRFEEMHAEVKRLRAIVDTLPKTADGVIVTPGMDVHVQGWEGKAWKSQAIMTLVSHEKVSNTFWYSTRLEAEKTNAPN